MSKPFQFKQFTIHQDQCAMKVGTDGVLLGAWVDLNNQPSTVLDIGAGTGLVALMLAQRSAAETLDAVEVDANAFEQCVQNFEASQWADRLYCYHASFQEFYKEMEDEYDLIVSNPPFYKEQIATTSISRDTARQEEFLPFSTLLTGVNRLLSTKGNFAVIIPFSEEDRIIEIAAQYHLFPCKKTHIKGNMNTPIKRSLLQFSRIKKDCKTTVLIIEKGRHEYTQDYKELTKDFYLKM